MIRELLPAQVQDPDRGSFYVNTLVAKAPNGMTKTHHGQVVYRASHHIERRTGNAQPHPYATEFVVVDGRSA